MLRSADLSLSTYIHALNNSLLWPTCVLTGSGQPFVSPDGHATIWGYLVRRQWGRFVVQLYAFTQCVFVCAKCHGQIFIMTARFGVQWKSNAINCHAEPCADAATELAVYKLRGTLTSNGNPVANCLRRPQKRRRRWDQLNSVAECIL